MDEKTPTVFVSYSHDTPEHKRWVAKLAKSLMDKGINVIFDQWDLRPGDDVPKFMEKAVRDAARVLMICSEAYVHKANEGKGGVGYEAMIVTGELVKDLGTSKFIPIVRQLDDSGSLPASISTRLYINFSDDNNFDEKLEELAREILDTPLARKPPLGKSPYSDNTEVQAIASPEQRGSVLLDLDETVLEVYDKAFQIARSNDIGLWRRLVAKYRKEAHLLLSNWREENDKLNIESWNDFFPIAINGARCYEKLFVIALAGVESQNPKFVNQISVIDDILYLGEWNKNGKTIVVKLPEAIAYIYQALHGAVCLWTSQTTTALNLSKTNVKIDGHLESEALWRIQGLVGWPESFERKCSTAWKIQFDLANDWPWISEIFGDAEEYQASICAYYMALNIQEYAYCLSLGKLTNEYGINVPLGFAIAEENIQRKAYRLLTDDREQLPSIWLNLGVTNEDVKNNWNSWVDVCKKWIFSVYRSAFYASLPHHKLIEDMEL